MKTIHLLITAMLAINAWVLPAQNRCAALNQEKEQLTRRLREINEQLKDCGGRPVSECDEKVLFTRRLEVRTQCAEVRGNTLIVHFSVRNGMDDEVKQNIGFFNQNSLAFDQEGRSYQGKRLTVGENVIAANEWNGYFDLVYNIWYKCSIEFFIGNRNVNHIKLLQLCIEENAPNLSFDDVEVK